MENFQTAAQESATNVNAQVLEQNYAIDHAEFAKITGAKVIVSGTPAEQVDKVAQAEQALRDLEKECVGKPDAYFEMRKQFLSDGSGPAAPIPFESLVGAPGIGDLEKNLDALAAEYGVYVEGLAVAKARSNKFLFGIMGKVYAQYALFMKQGEKQQKRIVNRLDAYMLDRNINVTGKTYTLSKMLMCVFVGADPKKINTYYAAITYAYAQGCESDEFAQYVENFEGGITAMRLTKAANNKAEKTGEAVMTRDEKLVQAAQWANARELAVFDSSELTQKIDATAQQIVLIATPLSGGKYAVRAGLSDKAVVDAAMLAFFKASKEDKTNEQASKDQEKDADELDKLAQQAASEAY